jgi:DNA-binding IclR family transcriptional regulator
MSESPAQFAIRTMRALEVLAFEPMGAEPLAEALGVHPRTARRLLSQLHRDGWLTYSRGRRIVYTPTLRFVALAAQIGARAPLAVLTAPAVARLHARSGLEATLAIPGYRATVCLVHRCGPGTTQPPLGELTPAHASATGRALLAHRDGWRRSILATPPAGWEAVDADALDAELAVIRERGYALEDSAPDLARQIAAPVLGPDGQALAAIALAVAADGWRRPIAQVAELLVAGASTATAALAAGIRRSPLPPALTVRLLSSHGLTAVDAHI